MTPAEFLARLQAAPSEAERDWLLMEFNLASLPTAVQQAIWAAAIPHWFDQPFLAALLTDDGVTLDEATWQNLLALSYVEPFAERGYNVHERTRTPATGPPVADRSGTLPSLEPPRRRLLRRTGSGGERLGD